MTDHPVHQPARHWPTISGPDPDAHDLTPVDQLTGLTPAQHAQLHAIVTHAVAIASREAEEIASPASEHDPDRRSPLAEPGVWIVLVMLALVTIVAVVALAAVLGLAAIGA